MRDLFYHTGTLKAMVCVDFLLNTTDEDATSPVIGVILIIAIMMLMVSVIGIMVMNYPKTLTKSEFVASDLDLVSVEGPGTDGKVRVITITHLAGEEVSVHQQIPGAHESLPLRFLLSPPDGTQYEGKNR